MNIDQLAFELEELKKKEAQARDARLAAEAALIAAVGLKDEGTQTVKTQWYKVSTTQSLDRKLTDDYAEKLDALPGELFIQIVKHKPQLDVTAFKKLATANPDAYRIACSAVITKPLKPAVKIERIEAQLEAA